MRATRRGRAYPGTQAVQRAMALLKAFSTERPVLRLPDLAEQVGLNKTTAYRLLTALETEGLVERLTGARGYRLGPELLALGSRALGACGLRAASRAELQALAFSTRETATLEVLVGRDVLILDEAIGDYVVGSMPSLGTRWPAHTTSTGKVLLASLPPAALDDLLATPLAAPTPRSLADPAALRRELARVRERGWALASEELEVGFVALGAPVRGAGGEVLAAVSVGGPKSRLNPERVRELMGVLPTVAGRISAQLGYRAPASAAADGRLGRSAVSPGEPAPAPRRVAKR
jgi:IclR family transcriptional regulator, acetate operon repressor